jgi:hypothetical protein
MWCMHGWLRVRAPCRCMAPRRRRRRAAPRAGRPSSAMPVSIGAVSTAVTLNLSRSLHRTSPRQSSAHSLPRTRAGGPAAERGWRPLRAAGPSPTTRRRRSAISDRLALCNRLCCSSCTGGAPLRAAVPGSQARRLGGERRG